MLTYISPYFNYVDIFVVIVSTYISPFPSNYVDMLSRPVHLTCKENASDLHIPKGGQKTHPCRVKSTWIPPIQKSVALESHLEEVKSDFSEIELTKPKDNLLSAERKALRALKSDSELNLKKANKRTTGVYRRKSQISKRIC